MAIDNVNTIGTNHNTKATIIYLDNGMLISKKEYANWLEIQEEYYENYKTSLLPKRQVMRGKSHTAISVIKCGLIHFQAVSLFW